jgi:tetratricopeptide (TPR) repeat protein
MEMLFRSFLSIIFLIGLNPALCQAQPAATSCSKQLQDSLIKKYLEQGAYKYGYNHPYWDLYCDSLIAACPNIAHAYEQKALPFIKNGDYKKAFPLEDKAVELDPKRWIAYRGFLKCIFTKDYEGAIIDFRKAQKLKPNDYEMDHTYFFFQGLCYLSLGDFVRAEENFKQDYAVQNISGENRPPHFNSLLYMGITYYEMKNFNAAKENLLNCLKQYPQFPEANFYLALIYGEEKNDSLKTKYLNIAKEGYNTGYRMNEDNIYYAYYPYQITLFEIEEKIMQKN